MHRCLSVALGAAVFAIACAACGQTAPAAAAITADTATGTVDGPSTADAQGGDAAVTDTAAADANDTKAAEAVGADGATVGDAVAAETVADSGPDTGIDSAVVDGKTADSAGEVAAVDGNTGEVAAVDVSAADGPTGDTVNADSEIVSADSGTQPSDATQAVAGNLVEAGWSFGECLGACTGKLVLAGAALKLQTIGWDAKVYHEAKGVLTTGAAAKLQNLESALAGQNLQKTYGCPDCNDGGAKYVVFSDGKVTSKHNYEYGKPPLALLDIDQLVFTAIKGLQACKGDDTVVVQVPCPLEQP